MSGLKRVALPVRDILAALPVDENIKPRDEGVVFEFPTGSTFGDETPAYRDPSLLAAWAYGFWAGSDAARTNKEDN